ncbi:MAG: 2-oxoacid:acceptor oxidoreductase family protein, partial [Planctomycetales bacterium]
MAASTTSSNSPSTAPKKPVVNLDSATVRFCGDSGDGMQLAGGQLSSTSALLGNDVATFPDFPAEIRAPRGTKAGVSGFQVHFASTDIFTPGDRVDAMVAMNPAALVTNLTDLVPGGVLIVNKNAFDDKDLKKAGYEHNPLDDGSLESYQLFAVEMTKLTRLAVKDQGLGVKESD